MPAQFAKSLDSKVAYEVRDPQNVLPGGVAALASSGPALGGAAPASIKLFEVASGPFTALTKIPLPHISFDLQGFGASEVVKGQEQSKSYGLSYYFADFDSVFQATGVTRTSLFGYTRAGYFAAKYAASFPERVKSLVLVEPALFTEAEELKQRAELALNGDPTGSIRTMLRYVAPTVGNDNAKSDQAAQSVRSNLQSTKEALVLANEFLVRANNPVTERDLEALTMPILLIGGTDSHVRDMIIRAATILPNASVWWVQGATLLDLPTDKFADEISRVIDLFLSRHA